MAGQWTRNVGNKWIPDTPPPVNEMESIDQSPLSELKEKSSSVTQTQIEPAKKSALDLKSMVIGAGIALFILVFMVIFLSFIQG